MAVDTKLCLAGSVLVLAFSIAVRPAEAGQPIGGALRADDSNLAACIHRAAGGRGWLEKTLWGLRDQEGGWTGAQITNADGSHDLGPLQVNSWWVGRIAAITGRSASDIRSWLIHDACFNVDSARWIFVSALTKTRDYWKAVGVYHSPSAGRQNRYAVSVAAHLRRRFGAQVFEASRVSKVGSKPGEREHP